MNRMKTPTWLRNWRVRRKIRIFQSQGSIPWTRGYEEFKGQEVLRTLNAGSFDPKHLPSGYGYRLDERIVEIPWLFSRLSPCSGRLLDAGSALNYEAYLRHPILKKKEIHICTLAPESQCFWKLGISYIYGDLRCLPHQNNWFDEVVCASTLEHVGMDNTRHYTANRAFCEEAPDSVLLVMREFARVLRPGGRLFITVPFGQPASHGWLRIFDRAGVEKLLHTFPAERREISIYQYCPQGWKRSSMEEAAEAAFFDVHAGKPWTPSQPASSGAVCCVELRKAG